jgi:intracellular multiplication protein IcmV
MAIKDIFKISRKTFFDPLTWLDYKSLKALNRTLFNQIRDLFTIPKPTRTETFEQALERFGLNADELEDIKGTYQAYAIVFVLLSIGIGLFSLYLIFSFTSFLGGLIGIAVTALALSQAFKYDFWVFQIKQQKLGCTFAEWKKARFGK